MNKKYEVGKKVRYVISYVKNECNMLHVMTCCECRDISVVLCRRSTTSILSKYLRNIIHLPLQKNIVEILSPYNHCLWPLLSDVFLTAEVRCDNWLIKAKNVRL